MAGVVITACALAGLAFPCDSMPGTDLIALLLALVIQGSSALASLVMIVVACARRDFRRAGVEAFVCVGMLLVIPLAFLAFVMSMPDCPGPNEGG